MLLADQLISYPPLPFKIPASTHCLLIGLSVFMFKKKEEKKKKKKMCLNKYKRQMPSQEHIKQVQLLHGMLD
jgi:hypothetical protein